MTGNSTGQSAGEGPGDWGTAAAQAADAVHARFGHRLMGLPGTWIGTVSVPPARPRTPWSEWHYWWQAHYLDAVVDAGLRSLRSGNRTAAAQAAAGGTALLRGILIRNFGRFPNYFFDDMAWLALAAARLEELSRAVGARPAILANMASSTLAAQLRTGHDGVLGGGIYWSRKRDFKNTPANGPAALHFARLGELDRARSIADWLRAELFDPATGLYLDGVHPSAAGPDVERTIYTYNQGPVLAALLELDHPRYAAQAAELVGAVERQLRTDGGGLRLEPGGDGSLFTGILCRYLTVAAHDPRMPATARAAAARMVLETAAQLAAIPARVSTTSGAPDPEGTNPDYPKPSSSSGPQPLSAAVQRWTVFEAAALLSNCS